MRIGRDSVSFAQSLAAPNPAMSVSGNSPNLVRECLARSAGGGVPVEAVTRSEMLRVTLNDQDVTVAKRPVPPPRRR